MPAAPHTANSASRVHYCLDASTIDVLWQYIYDHYLRKTTEMGLQEIIFYEPNIGLFPDTEIDINETNFIAFIEFCNRNALTRTIYDSDNINHFQVMGSSRWDLDLQKYRGVVVSYRNTLYDVYVVKVDDTHYRMYFLPLANGGGTGSGSGGTNNGDEDWDNSDCESLTAISIIRACRNADPNNSFYEQPNISVNVKGDGAISANGTTRVYEKGVGQWQVGGTVAPKVNPYAGYWD